MTFWLRQQGKFPSTGTTFKRIDLLTQLLKYAWSMRCWMAFLLHEACIFWLRKRHLPQKIFHGWFHMIWKLLIYNLIAPISKILCSPGEVVELLLLALLQCQDYSAAANSILKVFRCFWKNWTKHGMTGKTTQTFTTKTQCALNLWSYPCTSSTSGTSRMNIATTNTVWYQYNAPIPGIFNVLPIGVLQYPPSCCILLPDPLT